MNHLITDLTVLSGEQLLVFRVCGTPDLSIQIEQELDRRSKLGTVVPHRQIREDLVPLRRVA